MCVIERDDRAEMKSEIIRGLLSQAVSKKRSVVVGGHRTSVSLEPIFWDQLREIASQHSVSVSELASFTLDNGHQADDEPMTKFTFD